MDVTPTEDSTEKPSVKTTVQNKKVPKAQQALDFVLGYGVPKDSIRTLQYLLYTILKTCAINPNSFEKWKESFKMKWGSDIPDGNNGINVNYEEIVSKQSLIDNECNKAMFATISIGTGTKYYGWVTRENSIIAGELFKNLTKKNAPDKYKGSSIDFVAFWTYDVQKNSWKIQIKTQSTDIANAIADEHKGIEMDASAMLQKENGKDGLKGIFGFPK